MRRERGFDLKHRSTNRLERLVPPKAPAGPSTGSAWVYPSQVSELTAHTH